MAHYTRPSQFPAVRPLCTNGGLTLPRPNIKEVIHGFVGNQRIAVIGCGPNGLKVDVCNAVAGVDGGRS